MNYLLFPWFITIIEPSTIIILYSFGYRGFMCMFFVFYFFSHFPFFITSTLDPFPLSNKIQIQCCRPCPCPCRPWQYCHYHHRSLVSMVPEN